MIIDFHNNFHKRYRKLNQKIQIKVDDAIKKFRLDPLNPALRNHALTGRMFGKRAFWVTGNVRIIFEEHNHYVFVIILDVGTHNQIYN